MSSEPIMPVSPTSEPIAIADSRNEEVVIRVSGLGKCYQLFEKPSHRLLQTLIGAQRRFYREFWALRGINFEIRRGETLGIIGRNGSGKSTLLQLIAGTLSSTEGDVSVKGRVAALLELGSGFNPEFTGRENVYLNAAILGLSKSEVDRRIDEILAFADIGDFIDQPVRNYSSGMVMRLAFSVMTHVDADILIIDEALAVGDAFFTQKCMRYLREFKERGTLLFVSHDGMAVTGLCDRAIWLDQGTMQASGLAKDVMSAYLEAYLTERQGGNAKKTGANDAVVRGRTRAINARRELMDRTVLRNDIEIFPFSPEQQGFGELKAKISDVALIDDEGRALAWVVGGERVALEIEVTADVPLEKPIVGFYIKDRLGQLLFGENTYLDYQGKDFSVAEGEAFRARFIFDMPRLAEGDYFITTGVADGTQEKHTIQHWVHEAMMFKSRTGGSPAGLIGLPVERVEMERVPSER